MAGPVKILMLPHDCKLNDNMRKQIKSYTTRKNMDDNLKLRKRPTGIRGDGVTSQSVRRIAAIKTFSGCHEACFRSLREWQPEIKPWALKHLRISPTPWNPSKYAQKTLCTKIPLNRGVTGKTFPGTVKKKKGEIKRRFLLGLATCHIYNSWLYLAIKILQVKQLSWARVFDPPWHVSQWKRFGDFTSTWHWFYPT